MSKYLLNKFLFTVDRDPDLVERYREDPAGHRRLVGGDAGQPHPQRAPTARRAPGWRSPTRSARRCVAHDHVALFELGAHPFLTLTLFIAMFERDHPEPLAYQKGYGAALAHLSLPYPDIAT